MMTNFLLFLVVVLLIIYLPTLHDIYKLLLRVNKYIDFLEKVKKHSYETVMKIDGRKIRKSDVEKFL